MLSESDQYDQTVNAIYETLTRPQAWHNVCATIAGLIGARAVRITVRDKQLVNFHPEIFTLQENTDYYNLPEYWVPVLGIKSIESFARFESDEKGPGFGQVSESGHVLSRHILDTGEWLIALLCEFVSESDALAPSAGQWLDRLTPHVSRAAQLQNARFFAASELFAQVPFFDEWRQPAMLVALSGAVLRFNDATTQMLKRTTLVQIVDGLLELQGRQHQRILDECHSTADETPAYRMLRLTETEGGTVDAVYVFYHPVTVSANRDRAALFTFYHPDSPPLVDSNLLATAFDLTLAECRVACHIAEGRTPKEIAATIGVQHDTVRKQLQAIYQKTATNRQVDLLRLLLNLPAHPMPSAPPEA
ncbi:helix-turn-helix transcriptional regulator [Caballeronia sp. SEWSISQ10-4 2]|uniref:helix-turn-helix transcriptional regulator n=1 Tax=Caballeronia sp. SEWSISQ10-4 2 TaxID=2937438 RepID=UPI002651D569|nr:helix-turn-helix transcriptional regulator [Caballeronia sp. SEWSISQ10-4 2]MDN7182485.1 helix-turn-helix transcriptional regulator [Caballeronia sp. SEWSISQ10-4 2]